MLCTQQQLAAALISGITLFMPSANYSKEGANEKTISKGTNSLPCGPDKSNRKQPVIYLSFDDGPCDGSRFVNDLAVRNNIPINVFLVGSAAVATKESRSLTKVYKDDRLVEVGNHSYSHAHRKYHQYFSRPEEVLSDIDRNRDSLQLTNELVRLPGRNFFRLTNQGSRNDQNNGKEAADTLVAHGYSIFGWDIEWRRQAEKGIGTHSAAQMLSIITQMLDNQKTFLSGNIIILLHDRDLEDETFRSEIENFVDLAQVDGKYRFAHLSEYDHK